MRVRRALVDCAVLSVQNACPFYPCCKHCFSRIDVEERDPKRYRCSKCGFRCMKDQIDYRYRLSLRVTRDSHIFGLTVFGSCLDQFFGIHASGLQRLVEDSNESFEASTKSAILVNAVEDCFVGRHFIFEIKITDTENDPLLDRSAMIDFNSKETAQFITNQMSLPKAIALGGCSVISYYTTLLQKAADYPLVSTSPNKASRFQQTTLLLIPHQSPAASSSFNNTISPASCHLPQFLPRSQPHDHTVSPTPPWEQSLGLVTSSAEQEEDLNSQECVDESNSRQIHKQNVQHHTPCSLREHRKNYEYAEERILSPHLSLNENSSWNGQSFFNSPHPSIHKTNGNTPFLDTWSKPSSQPGLSKTVPFSSDREQTGTCFRSSAAWENMPLSESLAVFFAEENEEFTRYCETELNSITHDKRQPTNSNTLLRHSAENALNKSFLFSPSNALLTPINSHRRTLLDINNIPGLVHGGDPQLVSTLQLCRNANGCEKFPQGSNACSSLCKQEDEEGVSPLLRQSEAEEECLNLCDGESIYDCSAELFSDNVSTQMLETHELDNSRQTFDSEALSVQFRNNQQHLNSLSHKATADIIQHDCFEGFDFIPPSQSTPTAKTAVPSGLTTSSHSMYALAGFNRQPDRVDSCIFYNSVLELDSENPAKIPSSHCNSNSSSVNLVYSTASRSHSHRLTPKRKSQKLNKPHSQLKAQQYLRLQTAKSLNRGSTERRQNHVHDQSLYNMSVHIDEDVPLPSPKLLPLVKPRLRGQTNDCSGDFEYLWRGQQSNRISCKKNLSDQILTLSKTINEDCCPSDQSGKAESRTDSSVDELTLKCSINNPSIGEREACDQSKDLFSDSF